MKVLPLFLLLILFSTDGLISATGSLSDTSLLGDATLDSLRMGEYPVYTHIYAGVQMYNPDIDTIIALVIVRDSISSDGYPIRAHIYDASMLGLAQVANNSKQQDEKDAFRLIVMLGIAAIIFACGMRP